MSKKHKVIYDFDFRLIVDFFKDIERQGPCDDDVTRLILKITGLDSQDIRIADMGCGTGGQTVTLAENTKGTIIASDFMPEFVETLNAKVSKAGLGGRITAIEAAMDNLPFGEEEFDLMWAEGSIYGIGYEHGLREWRKYLKPGGFIAVSEATWFTDNPPAEIASFWQANYPQIDTIANKVDQMQGAGYLPVAHYVMPERAWWNYFDMQAANVGAFLERHGYSGPAQTLIEHFKEEAALYGKYREHYGYVFYVGQKVDYTSRRA